jgi:hypothetical protein
MRTIAVTIGSALIWCWLAVGGAAQAQTNHPPVPVATVDDDLGNGEYPTLLSVIAPDGLSVEVVFDASASSDPDGDVLHFVWGEFDEGRFHPFAEGVRASNVFPVESFYNLGLVVSDGSSSAVIRFTLSIYTPARAVDALIDALKDDAQPDDKPKQSLLGPLEEALTSFQAGDTSRAVHFLEVFQKKARVQTVTSDPERAEEVERITQLLLDKLR